MRLPVIHGLIERRLLINYRVDPIVLAPLLPAPFRPKAFRERAFVGICLIRLRHIRPSFVPKWLGLASENAAHRTAVEWDDNGTTREGVYVRRRDTNLWLNVLAGGRIFPGHHHHSRFDVRESADRFDVVVRSDDDQVQLTVRSRVAAQLPASSWFSSLDEVSAFFQVGSLGYSATPQPTRFDGLELRCRDWRVEPLGVDEVRSSFFDDQSLFPKGSIEFDCGLLMRNIQHEWHQRADLCCASAQSRDL